MCRKCSISAIIILCPIKCSQVMVLLLNRKTWWIFAFFYDILVGDIIIVLEFINRINLYIEGAKND